MGISFLDMLQMVLNRLGWSLSMKGTVIFHTSFAQSLRHCSNTHVFDSAFIVELW